MARSVMLWLLVLSLLAVPALAEDMGRKASGEYDTGVPANVSIEAEVTNETTEVNITAVEGNETSVGIAVSEKGNETAVNITVSEEEAGLSVSVSTGEAEENYTTEVETTIGIEKEYEKPDIGKCTITTKERKRFVLVHASCDLVLPTPCHAIKPYWALADGKYYFVVLVRQTPGYCVQMVSRKHIENTLAVPKEKFTEAGYKIFYVPAKARPPVKIGIPERELLKKRIMEHMKRMREEREKIRESVQKVEKVSDCIRLRLGIEEKIANLNRLLIKAVETGDEESAREIKEEIRELRNELKELAKKCVPRVTRKTKIEEIREKLELARALNPCTKIAVVEKRIETLKEKLENASDVEKEEIEKRIGVLIDVRDDLVKACEKIKEKKVCKEFARVRDEIREMIKENVSREQIRAKVREMEKLHAECMKEIKEEMEEHPCIASEVIRAALVNAPEEIVPELQKMLGRYRKACLEKTGEIIEKRREKAKEIAGNIAKLIGEIEIKKQLVLMNENLSAEEKARLIKELEQKKRELLKETIKRFRRARISAAVRARLAPGKLLIENEALNASNVSIELPTAGNESIEVEVKKNEIRLKTKRARVRAKAEIDFENGVLIVKGKAIKLPDEVLEKIKAVNGELELEVKGNKPMYKGKVRKRVKLLAFIPVQVTAEVEADASTGEITSIKLPWWARILATG